VCDSANVEMRIRGRDVKGIAEAVLDEERVTMQLMEYVRRIPMSARPLGVRLRENSEPHPEDADRLAEERLFVRIKIKAG
jgi:hypothetical protein